MKRILIVGSGIAGRDILREIKENRDLEFKPVGFIDDDKEKKGEEIDGLKVLGDRLEIKNLIKKEKIDQVIVAIPSAQGRDIADVVRICTEAKVGFRIVPRVKEIIEGTAHLNAIRKVRIEDLLGRPVVKSDIEHLVAFFKNKVVLITGAAGSIGSELTHQIAAYKPRQLILLDWWENGMFDLQLGLSQNFPKDNIVYLIRNIQDATTINNLVKQYKPDYIFHAAAYKHVPLMEDNPLEAVKNNIFGTLNIAKAAKNNSIERFVMVSSDKAANPINIMGATKLIAEAIVKSLNGKTKFITVRFGNVLGSNSSVIPIFQKQIDRGGPITITDKRMTRYFMTIPEAAQLILKAASLGRGGELFILDMGEPVKIIDLAENLIRLSGFVPGKDIKIVYTGKRKGEKIKEQLFNDRESLVGTKEEKIYKTQSLGLNVGIISNVISRFKDIIDRENSELVRSEFKKLFKSFY